MRQYKLFNNTVRTVLALSLEIFQKQKNKIYENKILLPLFAAIFFHQAMMAQFHIGVKGGANIIKIDGESFKDQFRYGYHIGGFAEIGLGDKFGIQPEVLFNQYSTTVDSNYKHVYQNVFNSEQSNVKLNYLSIPILLNYKLIGNFLSLQAGPQFSMLINQDKTYCKMAAMHLRKVIFQCWLVHSSNSALSGLTAAMLSA